MQSVVIKKLSTLFIRRAEKTHDFNRWDERRLRKRVNAYFFEKDGVQLKNYEDKYCL